jgi:hypothetical protein
VLATQLCPPGKFILTACSVQVPSDFEVISLDLALLAGGLGCRYGEEVDQSPELLRLAAVARVWNRLYVTHQIVDCGGSNRIDEVDDNFDNEDAEHKRGHLCESGGEWRRCNERTIFVHTRWVFGSCASLCS